MQEAVALYIAQYPMEIQQLFLRLRQLIFASTASVPEEKLWARLPSYYVEQRFIRLIPFKDHINISAAGLEAYRDRMADYRFTPKGMLQLAAGQDVPDAVLVQAFRDTLQG